MEIKYAYKNKIKIIEITEERFCNTNSEIDYTSIQIFNDDKIEDFFEIENENSNNPKEYDSEDIAIPQYPNSGPLKINAGCLIKIEKNQIYHYVNTYKGA